ncbi:MAG: disulfide bond formation protein DsbA [Leifsonia xyli]|nr:MAG: disulfide bond formation protein DsbA [Leifsonia xyli]
MSKNAKIAAIVSIAVVAVVAIVIAIVVTSQSRSAPGPSSREPGATPPSALAADSYILNDTPDRKVVLVEFLDFECEACGAFYPYVEQLREKYDGQVTFAFRYFPLPGHGNSVNAALAVESAARQGQLAPMFARMFETQAEWGEKGTESQAPLFRSYAEELGLDMAKYDADVASPEVAARVQADFDAAVALGATGTPTFFVNDKMVQLDAFEDLERALKDALAEN